MEVAASFQAEVSVEAGFLGEEAEVPASVEVEVEDQVVLVGEEQEVDEVLVVVSVVALATG